MCYWILLYDLENLSCIHLLKEDNNYYWNNYYHVIGKLLFDSVILINQSFQIG